GIEGNIQGALQPSIGVPLRFSVTDYPELCGSHAIKLLRWSEFVVFAAQGYINCCSCVQGKRTLSPQRFPIWMIRRPFMSDSFFPRWRKVHGGANGVVVQPDECMSWPQNIAMGAQHVVAMFGSTIL